MGFPFRVYVHPWRSGPSVFGRLVAAPTGGAVGLYEFARAFYFRRSVPPLIHRFAVPLPQWGRLLFSRRGFYVPPKASPLGSFLRGEEFVHMFVRHNYCLHRFPPAFPQELSTLSTGFSTGHSVENLDNCRFFGWAVKKTPQLFAQLWSSSVYRTPIFSLFPQSNRSLAEKTRWSSWLAFLWKSTWMQPSSTIS